MPRWSQREEDYLSNHAGDGAATIAEALGRTVWSVRCKASEMGVSLVVRYHCPRCGRYTYRPLTKWTGWCRSCSAAMKNREIRREIAEEEVRIREAERRRQAIYSDTEREKKKLRKFREVRQPNDKPTRRKK